MFDNLQERRERSFKILKGEGKITEINVAETLKDIRRALLDADVSFRVAKDFCDRVKVKAMGQNVLTAVKPQQMMVKIVHDELAEFMGSASQDINIKGNPGIVLVAGLNGSGKTTFSAKLANNIKSKRGMKVLLAACDTFRPAAIEQLKVLGEEIQVPVYTEDEEGSDPDRQERHSKGQGRGIFGGHHRHRRPPGCGSGAYGRDLRAAQRRQADRIPLRGRCDDRSGCRGDSQGLQRKA